MTTGHLFTLLSGAGRIDSVHVAEICDLNGYGSFLSIVSWGFNEPLDFRAPVFYDDIGRGWNESTLWGIGDYVGVELDKIEHTYETAATPFDYDAAWGKGKANTIAAIRWPMTGIYKGEPLVVYRKIERTHRDAGPEFEQPLGGTEAGYQLTVKGGPGFHTEMSIGLYAGCAVTAPHPINAINAVCAAKPGILGQLDMPHFYSRNVRRGKRFDEGVEQRPLPGGSRCRRLPAVTGPRTRGALTGSQSPGGTGAAPSVSISSLLPYLGGAIR